MTSKLVYGVGINDLTGNRKSKIYNAWANMIERCYSPRFHERYPTYVGCSVCEEWLTFSAFKSWMLSQDWEGKCLDKDILFPGNKIYSPETCAFISPELNLFMTERNAKRGIYPIGVSAYRQTKKFVSNCRENGKTVHLGYFDTPEEAHMAWRAKKLEIAHKHAANQTDKRVAAAIIKRYAEYALPAAAHGEDGRTCRFCQKRFESAGECGNHVDQFHHGEAEPAAHGDEAVRKDATESAIQRACDVLPEDWTMQIDLERGAGCVTLFNPWGSVVDFGQDFESIGAEVEAAIAATMRAQAGEGGEV